MYWFVRASAVAGFALVAMLLGGCVSPRIEPASEVAPLVFFNASPETVDRVVAELVAEAGELSQVVEQKSEDLILRKVIVYPPGNSQSDWREHLIVSLRSEALAEREAISKLKEAQQSNPNFEFSAERLSGSTYVLDYHSTSDGVRKWAMIRTLPGGDIWVIYVSRDSVEENDVRRWTTFLRRQGPVALASEAELAAGAEEVEFRSGPDARLETRLRMVSEVERPARFRFMPGLSFPFRRDLTGVWARGRFQVQIGADGHVSRIDVRDVFPETATVAMVNAVTDARFHPAEINQKPTTATANLEVRLRMLPELDSGPRIAN